MLIQFIGPTVDVCRTSLKHTEKLSNPNEQHQSQFSLILS